MLITLPVFCLSFCSAYLGRDIGTYKTRLKRFMLSAIIYTFVVLICIFGYAFIYAQRTALPFTDAIIGTMGFTTGSGPANNGYAVLVDIKWVLCYVLYALLGGGTNNCRYCCKQ